MCIRYNAPFSLTFSMLAAAIFYADMYFLPGFIANYFTLGPGFPPATVEEGFRYLGYALGHPSWKHLLSNLSFILLLGPILEEKYRSFRIFLLSLSTVIITAVLHTLFIDAYIMGSSGIVCMMILLISFVNIRKKELPLTFLLIAVLFIGNEIQNTTSNVAQLAYLGGAVCGSLFGLLYRQ